MDDIGSQGINECDEERMDVQARDRKHRDLSGQGGPVLYRSRRGNDEDSR